MCPGRRSSERLSLGSRRLADGGPLFSGTVWDLLRAHWFSRCFGVVMTLRFGVKAASCRSTGCLMESSRVSESLRRLSGTRGCLTSRRDSGRFGGHIHGWAFAGPVNFGSRRDFGLRASARLLHLAWSGGVSLLACDGCFRRRRHMWSLLLMEGVDQRQEGNGHSDVVRLLSRGILRGV